ncbi:MAG: beta-lactamase family protein [Ferruginibacter sp.]|nr:beta-lactamase family protein [Ferruginibacter sp.]
MKMMILLAALLSLCACKKNTYPVLQTNCLQPLPDSVQTNHPKQLQLQQLIDSLTLKGVPGFSLAVHQPGKGWFTGSSGYSDIRAKKKFQPCQVSRAGSVVKILTSISVLQLVEQGKLSLDERIANYLPAAVLKDMDNASQATVRQLLNHSSGIYNYIQDPQFQLANLNNLTRIWQPDELLSYARNRTPYFKPGEGLYYSNTGYILLGMLIEKLSGVHFSEYFNRHIFQPLHLKHTRFDIYNPVPNDLARGYTDWYNNGQIIESTFYNGWDHYTADGGLQSVPFNLCVVMEALFDLKLINQSSLNTMLTTIPLDQTDFFPMEYGLGIFKVHTPYGLAWFHSGDAIGYFGTVFYFPESQTTISWMTNGNYGTIDPLINTREAYERILGRVFN